MYAAISGVQFPCKLTCDLIALKHILCEYGKATSKRFAYDSFL